MKGMNMLCSSPASTAITSSTVVRRSSKRHASVRRKSGQHRVPCNSSQFPINPSPYHRKSLADKQNNDLRRKTTVEVDNLYGSSSTRYLLSDTVDTPFIQWVSDSHKISAMPIQDQVVVLRVSLHCKACEGKVRKHISKMEGVRSFSIDREAKKVTIRGDVTPLRVLASVSEVKSAQLWSSTHLQHSHKLIIG